MLLLGEIIRKQAQPQLSGRKTALIWGEETWTYAALNSEVNRLANGLAALGVGKGDRLAVLGRNCAEYVVIYFALAKLGAIMVPVNFWYRAGEVRYTLDQSGSTWLLVDTPFSPVAAEAADLLEETGLRAVVWWGEAKEYERIGSVETRQVSYADLIAGAADSEPDVDLTPDDHHIILYTSGTTGFPKGALFSHRAHYLHAMAWVIRTRTAEEDVGQLVYPLFHTGGPDCVLLPHFLVGATVILLDGADPEVMLDTAARWQATSLFCVPTVWRRVLGQMQHDSYDVGSVRRCLGSSDTFTPHLLDEILGRFQADVYVTYGLTEAGCILTFSRLTHDDRSRIGTVGKPHPLVEVRLADSADQDVPLGEVGEVVARGPTLMDGYWQMPEKTAETMHGGWLRSGDSARTDEEGFLYITGRLKDLIISGGENIYPIEIERLLREHPGVRDVAIVGVPDVEWSESVLAAVVPTPEWLAQRNGGPVGAADELQTFVRRQVAGFKTPRYVEFVDTLPVTTATNKVQKAVLRERYGERCLAMSQQRVAQQ
ncbi:MAG: o-succinylbenzoate--CoA ligase [Dehalococcoidia bacterium]|nr:o-succinylbenzoate--CoA ligase [Dehalococcoidia bacterium]